MSDAGINPYDTPDLIAPELRGNSAETPPPDFIEPPPLDDPEAEARRQGYSWPEIKNHIAASTTAALAAGYSAREVDDFLGYRDPAPLQDRLGAAWSRTISDDPSEFIEPAGSAASLTSGDDLAAQRVAQYAGQDAPLIDPGAADEPPEGLPALDSPAMRQFYAEALKNDEVKNPPEFAERWAAALWNAAPPSSGDHNVSGDTSFASSLIRGARALGTVLPSREDLTDATLAVADLAGVTGPEYHSRIKENLANAWADTGMSFYDMAVAAGSDPDTLAMLVQPRPATETLNPTVNALWQSAVAVYGGNRAVWDLPVSPTTQAMHELYATAPGIASAALSIGATGAEGVMRLVGGVIAGILAGGSQLIDEAMGDREFMGHFIHAGTPEENAQAGAKMLDALMTMMIHAQVSGGAAGLRGTPNRVRDADGNLVSPRAETEPMAAAAAAAKVDEVFDSAQKILDAPTEVVDPLKLAGETSSYLTTDEAFNPPEAVHDTARGLALNGDLPQQVLEPEGGTPHYQSIANTMATDILPVGDRVTNPVEVWHASPHDFERFSSEKIGAGQGAQSFGHGLYFAENEETALGTFPNREDIRLYRANLHVDQNLLLDLDKTVSAQSPEVEAALQKLGFGGDATDGGEFAGVQVSLAPRTGAEVLTQLERQFGKVGASEKLREAGLQGNRYLDQGSRTPAANTPEQIAGIRNHIEGLRNAISEIEGHVELNRRNSGLLPRFFEARAEEIAERRVLIGQAEQRIRELEAGSHLTRNYVIFHDARIEALEKDGTPIKPAEVRAQTEALAKGYSAADAVWAHFHNLMIDEAGGVPMTFFRTAEKTRYLAEYAAGRQESQALIRQFRGQADRFIASNAAKLDEFREAVNQHIPEYEGLIRQIQKLGPGNAKLLDGNPLHEMLKFVEGRSLGATMNPKEPLFPVAEMLRQVNMNMRAQIEASIPDMKSFRDDYYRHMWKEQSANDGIMDRIFGVGVQGSGRSLNARSVPTLSEGIEAGLIPQILNPIDNTMHYVAGMAYHLAAKDILSRGEASGYIKFKDIPSGWVQLNGAGATRAFVKEPSIAEKAAAAAAGEPPPEPSVMTQRAHAPPGFATSYNYWVGKGFYGMPNAAPWYTKMQYFANAMTGLLLGLPGYHFMAIAQESAVNTLANALGAISRGQIGQGLYGIGMGASVVPDLVRQTLRGSELYKRWLDLDDKSEAMTLFTEAGGRMGPRQEIYRYGNARSMFKSFAEGSLRQELVRDAKDVLGQPGEPAGKMLALLPGRLVGLIGKEIGRVMNSVTDPLFDHMIPNVKAAATFDSLESWLKANLNNPAATTDVKRAMARRIINSIDDRLGEMNQSNLFWPTALKQALNLATVSVGWEYGSLRAAGIAGNRVDSRATADRARWLVSLPIINGIMGSVYQYAKTGTLPSSFLETQFPSNGNGKHIAIPGYADKDFAQWAKLMLIYSREGVISGMRATADYGVIGRGNPLKLAIQDFFFRDKDAIGHDVGAMPRQALHWPFNTEAVHFHLPHQWPQFLSNLLGHTEPIVMQAIGQAKATDNLSLAERGLGFKGVSGWLEDVMNGTDKFFGGRATAQQLSERAEAQRYNRENAQLETPGEVAPVPPDPRQRAGGGGGRGGGSGIAAARTPAASPNFSYSAPQQGGYQPGAADTSGGVPVYRGGSGRTYAPRTRTRTPRPANLLPARLRTKNRRGQ